MKLVARRSFALLAWSPLLLTVAGCGNQGEGERCDRKNGNLDCDPGLLCKEVFAPSYHNICCPPSQATVAVCNASSVPPIDAGAITDTGTRADRGAETGAPDATQDPVSEPTDDRSTQDTRDARADISPDVSADMSTPDVQPEAGPVDAQDAPGDSPSTSDRALDATDEAADDGPSIDAMPDVSPDVGGEASTDAPLDITIPIDALDAGDAPAVDGPG
jgi:hypothetical protein